MNTSARARTVEHGPGEVVGHWNTLYATREAGQLSWTQPDAGMSAEIIDALPAGVDDPIVDVGGGAAVLVDHLLAAEHRSITELDVPSRGYRSTGNASNAPERRPKASTGWSPRVRAWAEGLPGLARRAVFHFLAEPTEPATAGVRPR